MTIFACGCGDDLTCDERLDHAGDTIEAALAENLACKVDADCTTVDIATACRGACPSAVAVDGLETVRDSVQQADEEYCAGYASDGCTVLSPVCFAPPVVCADGSCVLPEL